MNEKNEETVPSIGAEISLFTGHLESLNEMLPMTMVVLQEVDKIMKKKLEHFESEHCKIVKEGEDNLIIVPPEFYREWRSKVSPAKKMGMARILMPRSLAVTMVSQYDAFLGRLLRSIFLLKPETLNQSEKAYTFTEISSYSSLDAFKDYVIEKEVEGVLRKSHAEQFQYMEGRFDLKLTKDLDIWPTFIELTERRNLFVHSDGVVSRQYLSVCKKHGCKLAENVIEGAKLEVPQEYFRASYNCLYEIGVKLAHVLWRKLLPEQREEADESFNSTAYDLLDRGEYDLACALMDFALENFARKSSEFNRSILTVNGAQAHKWAGREQECLKIMQSCDWSAKGHEFKLAEAVLLEDWSRAIDLMQKIGSDGAVTKIQYRDWPLFKEFRKREEFLATYHKIYGETFEVVVKHEELKNSDENELKELVPMD